MTMEEVEGALEELVRPVVEADGGTIELVAVENLRVVVHLEGACAGCPGRPYTRAGLIEPALRKALGKRVEVDIAPRRTSQV
jgi:Fe-S cluster biogenesis protein NfuA